MIKFKKIYGTGFGSFVNETEFKLDRLGLNIIIAKNGSGKTTIFNLLYWTLYGTTLKDFKNPVTWPRHRTKDWKGTLGRVKFTKDGVKYEILRCKDWKGKILGANGADRLLVLRNGVDISPRDKRQRQELIDTLLGYTAGLFKNAILFGQKLKRLSSESGPEKKKVFDDAFESKFIKDSRDKAVLMLEGKQEELNEVQRELETIKIKRASKTEAYEDLKSQYDKQVKEKKVEVLGLKIKIEALDIFIKQYTAVEYKIVVRKLDKAKIELASLSNIEQEIKDLENREFRETNLSDDLEHRIGVENNLISAAKLSYTSILTKCPRCGQKLSSDKIGKEKEKLKVQIKEAKSNIDKLITELDAQSKLVGQLKYQISSKIKDKDNINSIKDTIRKLERDEKALKNKDDDYKGAKQQKIELENRLTLVEQKTIDIDLTKYTDAISKLRKKAKKIRPNFKLLRKDVKNLKWAIDDVLGNKGLKSYIFDTMLKELNELLKYYQQFIGYRVEFNVDLESANKDIYTLCYIGEHSCFYEELSGAQGQLVDIATAFALNDLVTRDRPINIMIFDEVMDNLDEENVEIVYDLINNKALTSSLFLISHDINLQNSSTKVIRMSYDKQSGQTIMKQL